MQNTMKTSIPVTLNDGSIVILSQLSVKDYASVFQKARQSRLQTLLGAIPADISTPVRREMIAEAYNYANSFELTQDVLYEDIETLLYLMYLALRKETKGITPEKVQAIMEVTTNWETLVSALNDLNADNTDNTGGYNADADTTPAEDAQKKTL